MENVQGLHYRTKDGPTMQFWPAYQHDFFQGPTRNITPQGTHLDARSSYNLVQDSTNLHNLPLSWDHITRIEERTGDAVGSTNWAPNWEWDGLRFTAHPATNGNNGNTHVGGQLPWGVREAEFSSPSPPDDFEENGAPSEPTLLEFGLTSQTQAAKEDDGLLDLKLGGNVHSIGASEAAPSVKRSRHSPPDTQQTRCQVDNCSADLQNAKDYHRRHKVCEFHAKAPKALVGSSMQRFCQQCSRFHLLKEFDDDRRSCRKRLAGHNRRRRKTQPDATATLACLLADPGVLARIIGSSGQQQGKEELETLLQGNPLLQALWNTKAAEGALPNNLINALSKSQLLSSLLLSNSTLGCTIPAVQAPPPTPPAPAPAPTEALISALSSALLASLPQLQQQKTNVDVGHDGSVPVKESGQPQGPYMNGSGSHAVVKQNLYPRFSVEDQSGLRTFPSAMERPPPLPTTPPVYSDKSNDSNGDSVDERLQFDSCQRVPRESLVHQDRRHWKARHKSYDDNTYVRSGRNAQTVGAMHTRGYMPDMHLSPQGDHFETTGGGGSDHSSDSGLDKQEQTGSLWFKIFDKNPSDLPSSLRNQIVEWLGCLPTDMEGYIKPGCIILTVVVRMPVKEWKELCRNIEGSLQKLVNLPDSDFWHDGRVRVHVGDASACIVDGEVRSSDIDLKSLQIPTLALVQPFAIAVGETVNFILTGSNLRTPGTKIICAYEGKCVYEETDSSYNVQERERDRHEASRHLFGVSDVQGEQAVTFNVGPFNNVGRSIIEVEGQDFRGDAFPIIVAEKSVAEEVNLLESKYIESCENNQGSAGTSSGSTEADIICFLYELGWLLQRDQRKEAYIDLKMPEFSISRYRWLLQFSVEHSFCAVVGRILDVLFSTDENSTEHAHSRAQAVLSDPNLLHLAVKNKSRAMVEFLVSYSPPVADSSTHSKRECYFRPDIPICHGLTPLHVAASMDSAKEIVDALTDAPGELWVEAWKSARDASGRTPSMYAQAKGDKEYVKIVESKLLKLGKLSAPEEAKPPHLALSIGGEDVKLSIAPSPRKPSLAKQRQLCSCKVREAQSLPLRIRGLNKGFVYRPFVLSMLAVAAVCVCVGVLMRGSPSVKFMQGPFVWESISFGCI